MKHWSCALINAHGYNIASLSFLSHWERIEVRANDLEFRSQRPRLQICVIL